MFVKIPDWIALVSPQVKETATSVLFQPLAFAPGLRLPLIAGAVLSMRTVTGWLAVPPALVAVQVSVWPAVSLVRVEGPQPLDDVTVDSASVTDQVTETSVLFHPFALGEGVTCGTITGGVVSVGGAGAMTWKMRFVAVVSSSLPPLELGFVTATGLKLS